MSVPQHFAAEFESVRPGGYVLLPNFRHDGAMLERSFGDGHFTLLIVHA
jgi:hypothetical protein